MKIILYIVIIFLNFNNLLALESKIIYKIDNEIITNIDIKNEFKYLSALNNQLKNLTQEQIFNISKESIIREKIKKNEVLKRFKKFEIDKKYLDKIVNNIYLSLELNTEEEFQFYLKKFDLEIKDIEEKIKIDALWNELIIAKYNSKININIEELKNEIQDSKLDETKNYLLSEIVFEIDSKEEINQKFNTIKKSIKEVGFKNTSSLYSIADSAKVGGDIGWVNEKSLNKVIRKKISSLAEGEISNPFIVPGGALILIMNKIEIGKKKINPELELKKAMEYQRSKQLGQYSKIYYNKVKKNLDFNE